MIEPSFMQAFLDRLHTIPHPSHGVRAYIRGVEGLIRLNAEDITAPGWQERWNNLHAASDRRWAKLSADDQATIRAVERPA